MSVMYATLCVRGRFDSFVGTVPLYDEYSKSYADFSNRTGALFS